MNAEIYTSMGKTDLGMNEDYVDVNLFEKYCIVLDGASGLTKSNYTGWKSDPAWFSYTLGKSLANIASNEDESIQDVLIEAGKKTAKEFYHLTQDCHVAKSDEPSAGLVMARWSEAGSSDCVEVASLGDCLCVVGFRNGIRDVVFDNKLEELDNTVIERMKHLIVDESYSFIEARNAVNKDLLENRSSRNVEGGYYIADPSCVGYTHALIKRYSIDSLRYIFMCSDGYYNAIRMGICSDFMDLAERVSKGDGTEILQQLRDKELADSEMLHFPRFKICDDATYALVIFDEK